MRQLKAMLMYTCPSQTLKRVHRSSSRGFSQERSIIFRYFRVRENIILRPSSSEKLVKKMSGGVGPSDDILLPKEPKAETTPGFRFSFWHVKSLAFMVLLSASGVVSLEDFAFVVFSIVYMNFLARIAFPKVSDRVDPPVFGKKNRILNIYVLCAAIIGMILPSAYIFEGVYGGDKEGIEAAASHLFLLSSQVVMEGVSFNAGFSLPIRAFVPIFYNSRRIFSLVEWLRCEIYKPEMGDSGGARRLYFGRALAMANMAFWCFNLFGFLLPV